MLITLNVYALNNIKNIHSYGEYVGKLSFVNFDESSNKNKDINAYK